MITSQHFRDRRFYDDEHWVETPIYVRDLEQLRDHWQLRSLDLSSQLPLDLEPLLGLSLESLSLARGQSLRCLPQLLSLRHLQVSGSRPLMRVAGGLSWLESLVLDDQYLDPSEQCASLTALAGLSQLTSLECLSCVRLRSLGPLAGLTRLRRLRVSGSQIRSLAPLRELAQLRELDCSRNPIRSLRALDGLGLEELKCYQSGLGQAEVDRFRSAHPECQVTFF